MKILNISPSFPIPVDNGEKRRVLAFAQRLSQHHEVTFLSLQEVKKNCIQIMVEKNDDWGPNRIYTVRQGVEKRDALIKAFLTPRSYREAKFWSPQLQDIIDKLLVDDQFDVIWVNFVTMSMYLKRYLAGGGQKPILILDQHNLDEDEWRSFLKSDNFAYRLFASRQLAKIKRFQRQWFPVFDAILSVSHKDLTKTKEYVSSRTKVWFAPNGVDTDYFYPLPRETKSVATSNPIIVYGGSMDKLMNQDAVHWYTESIHPRVQQQIPEVEFWIVGSNPPKSIVDLQRIPGIKVTGTVPDVRSYYKEASVFVIPSHFGGGTKLKTLEAMAMGLPIVSTSVGAQGLDHLVNGVHLHIVDEAASFADRIVDLLRDSGKAKSIGAKGYDLVCDKYNWDTIVEEIDVNMQHLLKQKGIPTTA